MINGKDFTVKYLDSMELVPDDKFEINDVSFTIKENNVLVILKNINTYFINMEQSLRSILITDSNKKIEIGNFSTVYCDDNNKIEGCLITSVYNLKVFCRKYNEIRTHQNSYIEAMYGTKFFVGENSIVVNKMTDKIKHVKRGNYFEGEITYGGYSGKSSIKSNKENSKKTYKRLLISGLIIILILVLSLLGYTYSETLVAFIYELMVTACCGILCIPFLARAV